MKFTRNDQTKKNLIASQRYRQFNLWDGDDQSNVTLIQRNYDRKQKFCKREPN